MIKIKDGFCGERSIILPPAIMKIIKSDPLASTLYTSYIGHYPKASFHFRERSNGMSDYLFIYCVEGQGWYQVNGARHAVRPNQFFILPANVPHAYGADEHSSWTIYWIHFGGTLAHIYADGMDTPQNAPVRLQLQASEWTRLFEEILETLKSGYSISNLKYVTSTLHRFFGMMCHTTENSAACKENNDEDDCLVNSAIRYMRENIERTIKVSEIAKYAGVSESHFTMQFRKKTGYSTRTYYNMMKIKHACTLLNTTDLQINQICHKVGIADSFYFSRLFSKITGVSPRQYRIKEKQE